jgi:hypothetical protein
MHVVRSPWEPIGPRGFFGKKDDRNEDATLGLHEFATKVL